MDEIKETIKEESVPSLIAEFYLTVTRSREILLRSHRDATLGSTRSINNVSAKSRNFVARAMNQRVCTRGNGAARNNLLRCKSDRMNRDGKQKLAPSRPQFRDITNGGRTVPKQSYPRGEGGRILEFANCRVFE